MQEFKGKVASFKADAVDTTGAGDSFVGGILNILASDPNLYKVQFNVFGFFFFFFEMPAQEGGGCLWLLSNITCLVFVSFLRITSIRLWCKLRILHPSNRFQ
jgi:hypothetical protein